MKRGKNGNNYFNPLEDSGMISDLFKSVLATERTARQFFEQLMALSVSAYEWHGFPNSVDTDYLEMLLFLQGSAVICKNDIDDIIVLPLAENYSRKSDIYGNPQKYKGRSEFNSYTTTMLDKKNSVIVYNDILRTPSAPTIMMFASRLGNIERTIDINVYGQRTPLTLTTDTDSQKMSILNAFDRYDNFSPVILKKKNFDEHNKIDSIDTNVEYKADKLQDLKQTIFNEALTYLGISNVAYEKSERMITAEVEKTQGATLSNRERRTKPRRRACNLINDVFDLNVSCNFCDEKFIENGGVNSE